MFGFGTIFSDQYRLCSSDSFFQNPNNYMENKYQHIFQNINPRRRAGQSLVTIMILFDDQLSQK